MHKKEIIETWSHIPSNGNILGREIKRNDRIRLYGINCTAMHFRRHKIPGTDGTFKELGTDAVRDFIYYMVSCDPAGLSWYHVSTQECNLENYVPHIPGPIERFLNRLFG